jgi:hypothetical protein
MRRRRPWVMRIETSPGFFDNPRRSMALLQIAAAVSLGILTREELASFSEELRDRVQAIIGVG